MHRIDEPPANVRSQFWQLHTDCSTLAAFAWSRFVSSSVVFWTLLTQALSIIWFCEWKWMVKFLVAGGFVDGPSNLERSRSLHQNCMPRYQMLGFLQHAENSATGHVFALLTIILMTSHRGQYNSIHICMYVWLCLIMHHYACGPKSVLVKLMFLGWGGLGCGGLFTSLVLTICN